MSVSLKSCSATDRYAHSSSLTELINSEQTLRDSRTQTAFLPTHQAGTARRVTLTAEAAEPEEASHHLFLRVPSDPWRAKRKKGKKKFKKKASAAPRQSVAVVAEPSSVAVTPNAEEKASEKSEEEEEDEEGSSSTDAPLFQALFRRESKRRRGRRRVPLRTLTWWELWEEFCNLLLIIYEDWWPPERALEFTPRPTRPRASRSASSEIAEASEIAEEVSSVVADSLPSSSYREGKELPKRRSKSPSTSSEPIPVRSKFVRFRRISDWTFSNSVGLVLPVETVLLSDCLPDQLYQKEEFLGSFLGEMDDERKSKKTREKEKREKEKERRKEREREKKEKEQREREEKERTKREKKEREKQEKERRLVPNQASDPGLSGESDASRSFVWRLFHTLTHIVFIFLLILTIGSLAFGTSTLFKNSAYEVMSLLRHGLTEANYKEVAIAVVGLFIFLLILLLTLLSAIMLIPALWVSLLEILVCPWSIISDYFLP